ncbi:MAG: efflux RND transporter periplasmic adaptor subunit [Planctomycetota bacterium]|nr:efflux RND transporter periplasmic adaptor subunit [Planctomycetota bacterium]
MTFACDHRLTLSDAVFRKLARTFIASAMALLAGCDGAEQARTPAEKEELPIVEAEVMTIAPQPWRQMIRSQGSLTADEVAMLGARVEGRVEEVHVDLGDSVMVGQPLVTLRKQGFQFHVEQAEAALLQVRSAVGLKPDDPVSKLNPENAPPVVEQRLLWEQAKEDLARAQELIQRKAMSTSELLQFQTTQAVAEARYNSAVNSVRDKIAQIGVREAELSLARDSLVEAVVLAPFSGRVQRKSISPGAYVRVGDSLVTLVKTDILRFRGVIPERYALRLKLDQKVHLQVESIPTPIKVTVTRISPALDLSNRSLVYEAVINNSANALTTGLFAEARIVIDEDATAIVIPQSALIEFAGAEKVWKIVDGESQEQEVLTGERRAEGIEILQGLDAGDQILMNAGLGRPARIKAISKTELTESRADSSPPAVTATQSATAGEVPTGGSQ